MSFWNYLGLSSKRDNEQLQEKINLLQQTIENKNTDQMKIIERNFLNLTEALSQQNVQSLSLLKAQSESLHSSSSHLAQQIENLEQSTDENLKAQVKELTKILKSQSKEIQKLEDSTQQIEKMNAELLKSMQAVWLIQLSQQVENELIK